MLRELIYKLLRFGLTGAACSIFYAILAHQLIVSIRLDPVMASGLAYGLTIPMSFMGQKYFTFKTHGQTKSEFKAFILTHCFGIFIATVLMAGVKLTPYDPMFGILAVMITVPLLSFFLMNTYVFKKVKIL